MNTPEEAKLVEEKFIADIIAEIGEKNYFMGNGDFDTYVEEEVDCPSVLS